jgi:Protein of unknown function (DUF1571)
MARKRDRHGASRLTWIAGLAILVCILLLAFRRPRPESPSQRESFTNVTAPVRSTQESSKQSAQSSASAHPLDDVLKLARQALSLLDTNVKDYTATLVKRERVNGKLGEETTIALKIRHSQVRSDGTKAPLHAYLFFESPASAKGREVIWVEGRNENKLTAHEAGLFNVMRVNLDPKGTLAMMGNKYPITEIGLGNLIAKLIEKGERDRKVGDCEVLIQDGQRVGDRECRLIQVTHPDKQPQYDFHIAQILLDTERLIPLRYAAYLWPEKDGEPVLEEEYTYLNVQLNVGLTDADFDPENENYHFP